MEAAECSVVLTTAFQHICNLALFLSFLLSESYLSLGTKEWGKVVFMCIWEGGCYETTSFIQKRVAAFKIQHLNDIVLHKPFLT